MEDNTMDFDWIYTSLQRHNAGLDFPLDVEEILPIAALMCGKEFKGFAALRELFMTGSSSDSELEFYKTCEPEALINILSKCLLFGGCHADVDTIDTTPIMALCGLSSDDYKAFIVRAMRSKKDNADLLNTPWARMMLMAAVERKFFREVTAVLER